MARRAQQSAVARCPWCDASLPGRATECPHCQFPLTMAAADGGGFRPAGPSGTSSTATSARAPGSPAPGGRYDPGRAGVHARVRRIRIVAWLLGLSLILTLLAGIGAVVSTSSPAARSNREAQASLVTALHRATDDPGYRPEALVTVVAGDVASDQATQVSADQTQGFWFGATRSASGPCHVLAARASDPTPLVSGTLAQDEPCSAAHVRLRYEQRLVGAKARP